MKVVLDTNVFVSGIHCRNASEEIIREWFKERYTLVTSLQIISEFVETMREFKIPLSNEDIGWWESLMLEKSLLVAPKIKIDAVKDDPDDNKFIEAAIEGKAEFIVSKDWHLRKLVEYNGIKIILPENFLRLLKA